MTTSTTNSPISVQGAFLPAGPTSINIAVAQILPSEEGLHGQGGLPKVAAIAQHAASRGADVVVFPEYFSGATHDEWRAVRQNGPHPVPHNRDDLDEEHWIANVQKLAKEHDINIVAGTVVELGTPHFPPDAKDSPLFNTAYCVSRQGRIAGRYTKRNLWHPERETLTAGSDATHNFPPTFELDTRRGHRFTSSLAICWDMAYPEVFRSTLHKSADPSAKSLNGPDVVFIPTCWYGSDATPTGLRWNKVGEASMLDSLVHTRAIETEAVTVLANISGPAWPENIKTNEEAAQYIEQGNFVGVGRSAVAAPFVGSVGRIDGPGEALLLASVDLALLQDAREVFRMRYDILAARSS